MQGLANFAQQVAVILAVLLPTFLYTSALGLFLFAAWSAWQQTQPHNPLRGKPWVPWLSLLISGACASFPAILTKVNISGESSVTVSVVNSLTSYSPVVATNFLGNTPGDTVLNVVQLFLGFFRIFGAMTCFCAMMAWHAVECGRSNRQRSGCGVQFVFGTMLINIYTIAQWLVGILTNSSGTA